MPKKYRRYLTNQSEFGKTNEITAVFIKFVFKKKSSRK
jgi:hypothetical protein